MRRPSRRFAIWLGEEVITIVRARSDYSALLVLARALGLPESAIEGTYRLRMPDNHVLHAVEAR